MRKKPSQLTKTLVETAKDMREIGILDEESYKKITMRLLNKEKQVRKVIPMKSKEIRAIREREHLSQAVFANYLNLSVGYVSQLERGLKQAKGPLLTLLSIVSRKGLSAIR